MLKNTARKFLILSLVLLFSSNSSIAKDLKFNKATNVHEKALIKAPAKKAESQNSENKKPHILFIAIDDLNDMIPLLDKDSITHTPNFERLAKFSTVFTNAYASSTLCNPSRFSLLTGLRPSTTGVYLNVTDTLSLEGQYTNIMTHFRANGYKAIGIGKIWHGTQNHESAWDEYYSYEKNRTAEEDGTVTWPFNWGVVEEKYVDQRDNNVAAKTLETLAKEFTEPTFLAVGFHNPHLPWIYTKEDFELYPLDKIKKPRVPEYDHDDLPDSGRVFAEQYNFQDQSFQHERVLGAHEWKRAIQAYLTAITYVDKQLGKVLDALEKSPNKDNTLIVLWSDHGYHLGEKFHWNKHALWEKTTHVPFIISIPPNGLKLKNKTLEQKAQKVEKVVSLLDIFPTLIQLSGIQKLKHLEGESLVPLLSEPELEDWDHAAITTMDYKNHAIRTNRWRYIRYKDGGEELYDKFFDPKEYFNIEHLDSLKSVKKNLRKRLPEKNAKPVKTVPY